MNHPTLSLESFRHFPSIAAVRTARGKVLVLGSDNRGFLTVIRSLGRQGLVVDVGWCPPGNVAAHSRYIRRRHCLPEYSPTEDTWLRALMVLLRREAYDLVIPCDDQSIIPLHARRRELEPLAPLYLLDDEVFEVVSNKARTTDLARSLGIPVPREMAASSHVELETALAELRPPYVLKPLSSFTRGNVTNRNVVRKYSDPDRLRSEAEATLANGPVVLQENVVGRGIGLGVLADQGHILAAFQHIRLHEPLTGGGSSYRESMPVTREFLDAATKMLGALRYTGVAMLEFKADSRTGEWVLLEINGRFWGSLPLAVAAGIDFPFFLYQLLVWRQRDFPTGYEAGLRSRNWVSDLPWFKQNLLADHSDPMLETRAWWRVLMEGWWIVTMREFSDTLVWDDPVPGLIEIPDMVSGLTGKVLDAGLRLPLIRFQYGRRIQKLLEANRTVLFCCTGNICRSPFAEGYVRTVAGDALRVASAGLVTARRRLCPTEAVVAAAKWNVDLSEHRSVEITGRDIAEAGVIFVFDRGQYRRLEANFPRARHKLFYLGVLADVPQLTDPYGGGVEQYLSIYGRIAAAIDRLVAVLPRVEPATRNRVTASGEVAAAVQRE